MTAPVVGLNRDNKVPGIVTSDVRSSWRGCACGWRLRSGWCGGR